MNLDEKLNQNKESFDNTSEILINSECIWEEWKINFLWKKEISLKYIIKKHKWIFKLNLKLNKDIKNIKNNCIVPNVLSTKLKSS